MANWLYWGFKPVRGEDYYLHPYYAQQQAWGQMASFFGLSCLLAVTVSVIVVGVSVISSPFAILVVFGFAFYARVCGRSIFRVLRSYGQLAPNLEADVRRCRKAVRRRNFASTPWQYLSTHMRAFILWAIMARPLDEAAQLKALGDACIVSYDATGQMKLLQEALEAYIRCLQRRPSGCTLRGIAVRDLSLALWQYCRDRDGDVTIPQLDECLKLLRETLDLHPTAHDVWMPYYASALEMRFKHTPQQDLTILVQSIELYRKTLRHWFLDHPAPTTRDFLDGFRLHWRLLYQKPELWPTLRPSLDVVLSQLGCALLILFREQGNLNTLEEAITLLRRALRLRQQGHPARHLSLHHLAAALHVLCEERGDSTVSDEAIVLYEEALWLSNDRFCDGSRGILLDGFGIALITSFRLHRDLNVLTKSVLMLEEALQLHPRGHSARGASLRHLGDALRIRAEERGDWNALADAISRYREALQASPGIGHDPVRDELLNGLGIALLVRFRQTGSLDSLTEAIVSHREALRLQRSAHHSRGFSLNYLALGLVARSHQQGGLADLDEALNSFARQYGTAD
jgi:tetratricopeptide (TPR) repeat protein